MSFGVFIGVINFANIIADMICCAVIGFFLVGLVPISFNFSGEMAYPESEATSSAQGSTHRSRVGPRQPDSVLGKICARQRCARTPGSALLQSCGDMLGVVIIEISKYLVKMNLEIISGKIPINVKLIGYNWHDYR